MGSVLDRGATLPHFDVRTTAGVHFSYAEIWQRRSLVLVALPETTGDHPYAQEVGARERDFAERASVCVTTTDSIPGLPAPGVLIADRWGEIVHIVTEAEIRRLPRPEALLEWVEYIEHRCPECEGEAR